MSDLALQLITENEKTRATFLDLGNCGLTQIPAEIGELVWLESVSFASAWTERDGQSWQEKKSENSGAKNDGLIDIGPLAGLTRMRSLVVSGTQVTDLAPLAGLTALQTLDVSRTQVTDLAPLADLTALQTLYVWRTQVTDLAPLAGLTALQTLFVWCTQVTDLVPLAGLTALQNLFVWCTQVTDLVPLAGLTALQNLFVSDISTAGIWGLTEPKRCT